jgi:pyrroline-5-carboxylate reductase
MAGAMLEGWLDAGIDRSQVTVVRPSGRPPAEGIRTLAVLPEDEVPALVLLGVKPQKLDEVAPGLGRVLEPPTVLVSILAGVELAVLRARFAAPSAIVRAMPNLAVSIRRGLVPLFTDGSPGDAGEAQVEALMSALGETEWIGDERLFALAGHLTAAAPAFLFRFIEALADAAAELGLPADQAARLAAGMAAGAATLAERSSATPAQLAARVASPGGTTEAGLQVLDGDEGLRTLLHRTLAASRRRGEELAAAAAR